MTDDEAELIPYDEYPARLKEARAEGRIWPGGPTVAEVEARQGKG